MANWWRKRKLRSICPHSRINARGTCQMCGKRGIELLQSAVQSDGGDDVHTDASDADG